MTITASDLAWARGVVGRTMPPTPLYRWPLLCEATGHDVLVKHENHTPAGAFKVRGGLVYAERLKHRQVSGLITATRGNHGQSIALAGTSVGVPVTVVVPHGNSREKNAATRAFGAELIEHGDDFQAAREHAMALAGDHGLEPVPPYHPDLVLGVSTYAAELFDAAPDLDVVYVPIGQGSGISGLIHVRDLLGLRTEIVGVVAAQAPAMSRSFDAGAPVSTDTASTFVDGVACRVPEPDAVAVINSGAARIVAVSEDAAAEAMRLMLRTTHNLAEPAGALALAGLLADDALARGRRIAVIHTGGNVDAEVLATVLGGRTPVP